MRTDVPNGPSATGQGLRIGGFTPFTATDYPGYLAAVVFCQGCPWRCSYCHNPHLLPANGPETHDWADILTILETRRGLLDAVVFSGGEPTLQQGLPTAIETVRAMGFKVGLHSAGMYPERLASLLPLIDWIGLDVKALTQAYPRITGVPGSGEKAWESVRLVVNSGVAHQMRCTWSPVLFAEADLECIRHTLRILGAPELDVQECRPTLA